MNLTHFIRSVHSFSILPKTSLIRRVFQYTVIDFIYQIALGRLNSFHSHRKTSNKFSIHTLLSHWDIPFYIIGIFSLLRHLKFNPRIFVYDDGSLTKSDYQTLKAIPRVFIITPLKAEKKVRKKFKSTKKLLEYRAIAPHNRKLIDIASLKQDNEKLLILDSDVIFFRYPKKLIKFLTSDRSKLDMLYIQDIQLSYIAPISQLNKMFNINCPSKLNSGVLAFKSSILTKTFVENYYRVVSPLFSKKEIVNLWIEQTGYAVLAAKVNSKVLPSTYSIGRSYNHKTICKHYVHDFRSDYDKNLLNLIRPTK